MHITRENYEHYFLDYLERSLDPSLVEEMELFLDRNPDLKDELEKFEQVYLQPDPITFANKEQLKKSSKTKPIVHESNFEHFCVANLEGDLTTNEKIAFNQFLDKYPEREKDYKYFQKTILHPQSIIFPDKQSLKKKAPATRRKYAFYTVSAAASILVILVLTFIITTMRTEPDEQLSIIPTEVENEMVNEIDDSVLPDQNIAVQSEIVPEIVEQQEDREPTIPTRPMDFKILTETNPEITKNRTFNLKQIDRREIKLITTASYPAMVELKMKEEQNPAAEDYLTLRELFAQRLRGPDSTRISKESTEPERITFLDIADAGIRGISRIPGINMKLARSYDQHGELASYAFSSRNLSFSREVKK